VYVNCSDTVPLFENAQQKKKTRALRAYEETQRRTERKNTEVKEERGGGQSKA
jgi:hypothetical protein